MREIRLQFCPNLKKNVQFLYEYDILKNGNGRDKIIGMKVCNFSCPFKEDCKFSKMPIKYFK